MPSLLGHCKRTLRDVIAKCSLRQSPAPQPPLSPPPRRRRPHSGGKLTSGNEHSGMRANGRGRRAWGCGPLGSGRCDRDTAFRVRLVSPGDEAEVESEEKRELSTRTIDLHILGLARQ
mmetsp:Transcript_49995/g.143731  ORF Transcript_49995/g.143731 Transcript_49995/m.143731 type:complete len:118 (-) Transcript_49995:916-1269(-)